MFEFLFIGDFMMNFWIRCVKFCGNSNAIANKFDNV